jgi:hypothetical protein
VAVSPGKAIWRRSIRPGNHGEAAINTTAQPPRTSPTINADKTSDLIKKIIHKKFIDVFHLYICITLLLFEPIMEIKHLLNAYQHNISTKSTH